MSVEDGMSAQDVWNYPINDPADPTRSWVAADLLKWANAGANEVADVPVNVLAAKVATPDGSQSFTVAQHLAWTTLYAEQAVTTLTRIADKLGVSANAVAQPADPPAQEPAPDKPSGLTGYAISLIRTYVPLVWGTLIGALLSWGVLPSSMAGEARAIGASLIVPVCVAAFYALVRWLEHQRWVPRGFVRAVLGSTQTPRYQ